MPEIPLIPRTVPGCGESGFNGTPWKAECSQGYPQAAPGKQQTTGVMNKQRYKTRREIADVFGVGVRTVSLWMRRGCPVIYTGKKLSPGRGCHPLFIAEEVEQLDCPPKKEPAKMREKR